MVWAGVVAAYGAFWPASCSCLTSFGRASSTNALTLAAAWLLLVVVLPSTLNMAVGVLYPMPSRVEVIAAVRAASDDATARGDQLLAKYYGDHPELVTSDEDRDATMADLALARLAIDDAVEQAVKPLADRYTTQLGRQQALVDRFACCRPPSWRRMR